MTQTTHNQALITTQTTPGALDRTLPDGLTGAILAWADHTTDPASRRRADLLRDKRLALEEFFGWVGKRVDLVTALDVKAWQALLEERSLATSTVYGRISRISSFYDWALSDPQLAGLIRSNPVSLARPKAPKAYQSESTQALDDHQLAALLRHVRGRAAAHDLVGLRDYAMLLLYVLTGLRRAEVVNLRWGDVKINGALVLRVKTKGGEYSNREVRDPSARDALLDYLTASGRPESMQPDSPLWTRHDRAGQPGAALTSHAFVDNLKRYAALAGIEKIHLHQTRHTYARIVSEESGSMGETQEALGHKNRATTAVYVQRIGIKRDKYSSLVAQRLDVD